MTTYAAETDWRIEEDRPVGRHRLTHDSGSTAQLQTELREESFSNVMTMERFDVAPLSRLVQPVSPSQVSHTLLDASLLDLLD